MSFSNSSGGTLALPSPTHAHQIDVTSAVRTLRRSLSRSPSKFLSRTNSHSSDNNSSQLSPRTPSRRFGFTPQNAQQHRFFCHQQDHNEPQSAPPVTQRAAPASTTTTPHRAPLLTPLRASVKLSLRSAKSIKALSPASRHLARSRSSPKSPVKRPLTAAPDAGNFQLLQSTTPTTSPIAERSPFRRSHYTAPGQENSLFSSHSTTPTESATKLNRHSLHLDVSGVSQSAFFKALDANDQSYMTTTTGALKRNDATMNLDHPNQGSPVAKRRSMYGVAGNASTDSLSIFGTNTTSSQSFDIHEDPASEYELFASPDVMDPAALASPSPSANVPKRSSSLRKSTLQQRYGDRGSLGRRNGERQLAQLAAEFSTPGRSRPRLSTDHFVPPQPPRDSPFSSGTPLPNASIHFVDAKSHQPHPLSKSLVSSNSGGSLTEEETTPSAPLKFFDKPKAHPFSKSLPLNATRPTARPTHDHTKAVATPNHANRLWTAAFNSTGLISKVNRNPEEEADRKIAPPDTPCKKHSNPFATFPPPVVSGLKRRTNSRGSFSGLPSTPFNATPARLPETFGNGSKGLSIFQRDSNSMGNRRGSLLSLDGEDRKLFGDNTENLPIGDSDAPPTPTKNVLPSSLSNLSEQSLESPSTNRTFALPVSAVKPPAFTEPSFASSIPADGRRTPQTPHEGLLPLDTSRLSISLPDNADFSMPPPVTPTTTDKDFRSSTSIFVTPVNVRTNNIDVDASLVSKFDRVEQVGKGEFSTVYRVTKLEITSQERRPSMTPSGSDNHLSTKGQVYAVKKSRHSYQGRKDRDAKLREAKILQALSHAEHVVHYVDDWEHNFHLYIQTEFCEEGTLERFLSNVGRGGRLDDFRIFKILQDLCLGLKEVHDAGFMHLDMKPANILVTFEGDLKIADFGLAQSCVNAESVDVEGDREYMSPEMLKGQVGKAADVFSLGLITLEVAANVVLPDNGPTWVALRSGDLSEVPSLTWTPSIEVQRDSAGNPTETVHSGDFTHDAVHSASSLFSTLKPSELQQPPEFMVEAYHPSSLDSIVRWMTAQEPGERPVVDQILDLEGLVWVSEHRNAPATVFEGNWGPAEVRPVSFSVDSDTEMTDI